MKREELTQRRSAFQVAIRKAQHKKMLQTKRRRLEQMTTEPVDEIFQQTRLANNDKKKHLMLSLVQTLGQQHVFKGKPQPLIDYLSKQLCSWFLHELENAKDSQTTIQCLMGLANLMGDKAVNDTQLSHALVTRLDKYFRGRYDQSPQELHQLQWIYSNIMVKGTLHLPPQTLQSIMSILTDMSVDEYSVINQRLPRIILQTVNYTIRQDDRIYDLCRLNLQDMLQKVQHYLRVQDRERAHEAIRFIRYMHLKDNKILNFHEHKSILMHCLSLLKSTSTQLKQESIKLVTILAQNNRNVCQFIAVEYLQKLVKHLLFEQFKVKKVILLLFDTMINNGGMAMRDRFLDAKLYVALRNIIDQRFPEEAGISLDIVLKSIDTDEHSDDQFVQYLVSIGWRQAVEKIYMSNLLEKLAEKCRRVLELMHNIS